MSATGAGSWGDFWEDFHERRVPPAAPAPAPETVETWDDFWESFNRRPAAPAPPPAQPSADNLWNSFFDGYSSYGGNRKLRLM